MTALRRTASSNPVAVLVGEAEQAERRGDWHAAYTLWNRAAWASPSSEKRRRFAGKAAEIAGYCVIAWNRQHPAGTEVRYWPAKREGEGRIGRTREDARVVGGAAAIWVDNYGGCIALSHVEVLGDSRASETTAPIIADGPLTFRDEWTGGDT